MKSLLILLVLSYSLSSIADCGLNGTFEERVKSCNQSYSDLQLVMDKGGSKYWFSGKTKSIFQIVHATPWQAAKNNCQALKAELTFTNVDYDWDLAFAKELTESVKQVYSELNRTTSDYDERRYWLGNAYNHPTGRVRAAFYSTKGYLADWFADASDAWYAGGICSLILK